MMKKKRIKMVVGVGCMALGLSNAIFLDIDNTWHYFGNGALFGIGISLLVSGLTAKKQE